jgi:DNA polymerase-3 subunit beta
MKAIVSQQQLAHSLGVVGRAVSARSSLPVLANVLIASDEGRLRLSATNLEMGITCWIGAQIIEEGSITVPARTFADLVSTLPSDNVQLDLNNNNFTLNIRCGSSNTDIKGIDAQEFPPMPVADPGAGIVLNTVEFKEMVQQVAFAASTDEARMVLQGVHLTLDGDEMTMAATDGFRISVRKTKLANPPNKAVSAIIPARALGELARIASDSEENLRMVLNPDRGQVLFVLKDIELDSQIIEGNFPDYQAVVPTSFKTTTIITTNALQKACRQAEIIARDVNYVIRLFVNPGDDEQPGRVEISAQSEETGSNENFVEATIDGEGLPIAFNVRFLREALDAIKTPNVALKTNANNTPALLTPVGDSNFLHIIMPMHLV